MLKASCRGQENNDGNPKNAERSSSAEMQGNESSAVPLQEPPAAAAASSPAASLRDVFPLLAKESRHFNLDLAPAPLFSSSALVELLIQAGVSKYLEFKTLDN